MQKSYLLLHNNQQSGPYSLEELTAKALQAKDLVWIIGQSAGWRYPEEIEALKTYVQGSSPIPPPAASVEPRKEIVSSPTVSPFTTEKAASPSTRHIYVSFPIKPVTTATEQAPAPEAATLSFEERVEKMRQRVASAETEKELPQEPEVETKYSRSLDDIKAEYTGWMHKQKRRKKINIKPVVTAVTLFLGVVGSVWGIYYFITHSSANEQDSRDERLVEFNPTPVQPGPVVKKTNAASHSSRRSNTASRQEKKNTSLFVKASQKQKSGNQPTSQQTTEEGVTVNKNNDSPKSITEEQNVSANEKKAAVVDQLQLQADYIAGSRRQQGVGGLEVALKNNSDQMMKVVAVDVIYYGPGMEEIDRKTLYFSDLQPGQRLTRKAPAHKKAEGAYAQLGLISSEAGNIFYASN